MLQSYAKTERNFDEEIVLIFQYVVDDDLIIIITIVTITLFLDINNINI